VTEEARREERELVEAASQGDERAFDALYHANRDFVLRVAARFGASGADAHDVLQEVFIYLVRKLPTLTLSARLSTLLYTVAKNAALKKKNTLQLAELPADDYMPGQSDDSLTSKHDPTAALEARARLARLPVELREVVALRFFEEFRLEEIAAALGIPTGTVKSRLHNALKLMRQDE